MSGRWEVQRQARDGFWQPVASYRDARTAESAASSLRRLGSRTYRVVQMAAW